jgi:hypothetical protein
VISENGGPPDTPGNDTDVDAVEPEPEVEDYSPTELAKLAGVKSQMIYNYIKANLIVAFKNDEGRIRIKRDVAHAWVTKYQENKRKREAAKAAKLERDFKGLT